MSNKVDKEKLDKALEWLENSVLALDYQVKNGLVTDTITVDMCENMKTLALFIHKIKMDEVVDRALDKIGGDGEKPN